MDTLKIDTREVGDGLPPYVIAEIGANHNGDMALCRRLIDSAKACGADAVKFQSWSKHSLISKAEYARRMHYADKERHFGTLEEMVERYQLTEAQHKEVKAYCDEVGVAFLSSVFSRREVDLLEELGVGAHKLASMDVTHLPLLNYVGATGKPVILSTGMSTLAEIETALHTLRESGSGPVALLHCISIYPPAFETINLRNIVSLRQMFQLPVGFSDHSIGVSIPLAAIALGACVIEKHFTIDKTLYGWDHGISADPAEMGALCTEGRHVFESLGRFERVVSPDELAKRGAFRRRIVLKHSMTAGAVLTADDLDYKRPGTGIGPEETKYVIGRRLRTERDADHELEWSDLE